MIINYSLCIIYDMCSFIMFAFKYEENRQVIAQVINYQPAICRPMLERFVVNILSIKVLE